MGTKDKENEQNKNENLNNGENEQKNNSENQNQDKGQKTPTFEEQLAERLNDNKYKQELILQLTPEFADVKSELEKLRKEMADDKEKRDFKEDPDATLQAAKERVAQARDEEWGIKLNHTEELLKEAQKTIEEYVAKENEAILNDAINGALSEYSIREGADKDVIELLRNRFFVNDKKDVVSLNDGVESAINIEEFVREFFKERPYCLNDKRGSGTFNSGIKTRSSKITGFEELDAMFRSTHR